MLIEWKVVREVCALAVSGKIENERAIEKIVQPAAERTRGRKGEKRSDSFLYCTELFLLFFYTFSISNKEQFWCG
jgi:hypothetical protein